MRKAGSLFRQTENVPGNGIVPYNVYREAFQPPCKNASVAVPAGRTAVAAVPAGRRGILVHDVVPDQIDPSLRIDLVDLHFQLIPDIDNILHLLHPVIIQLGDMDHAVLAGSQFHKGAEVHNPDHLAGEHVADLDVLRDALDNLPGFGRGFGIRGGNVNPPVVLDIEDAASSTARTADLTQQQRTDHAIAFCETIKEGGYTPMLYCNIRWFIEKLDITRIADYEKWFAQYFRKPFFPYTFRVWQYSSSGAIDGIKGNVDYNISFYDYGNPPAAEGE